MLMAGIPALDDFLDRTGIPVDATALLAALTQVGTQRLVGASSPSAPLTANEASVLRQHAGVIPEADAATRLRAQTAAKSAMLYANALTTGPSRRANW